MLRRVCGLLGLSGLFCLTAGLLAQPAGPGWEADRAALVAGVKAIATPGLPGTVVAFGERAFPVVSVPAGKEPALVVAAGRLGKGRVVLLGHEGYFSPEALKKGDTQRLMENALRWASGQAKPTVSVVDLRGTAKELSTGGVEAVNVPRAGWVPKATTSQVIVVNAGAVRAEDVPALRRYLENGGGLITALPGWGWEQVNPGKSLARDNPAQTLLAGAGLALASDTITAPGGELIPVGAVPPGTHVREALKLAEAGLGGKDAPVAGDLRLAQATLVRALEALPAEETQVILRRLQTGLADSKVPPPTPARPLKKNDAGARLVAGLRNRLVHMLPAEQVQPAPGADAFPGSVPKEAARIVRQVTFPTGTPGYVCDGVGTSSRSDLWHSTGLYAAPGEVITVELPAEFVGKGLQVQIGAHSDTLWHLDTWRRSPDVVRRYPLDQARTAAANAFGGLVYLVAPVNAKLGVVRAAVRGAVEAPLYVHGKTTREEWAKVRNAPGPWAEFVSDKVILTVPSDDARQVADPVELMNFWDRVLDACADLSAVGHQRGRAERLMHDVQISAGYMHSGYPIMCPLNEGKRALDVARMQREGAWGYFHELGHNHQGRAWTFDGTVEVTCNLYSIYVTQTLCPKAPLHEAIQPASVRQNARKYRMAGAEFADWKNDPFTALIVYKQMEEAFGWDTFKKVFREYLQAPAGTLPRNDADERDQWLVRFSRACGKNLTPAFEYWGIPVSDGAKQSVANLPAWTPPDPTR